MKLTKKQEKEIGKIYDTWLHAYLNGDVRTYNYYLDKDYHFIGSTNNEEFLNRKNTTDFFKKTGYQLDGKTDIRNDRKIIGTYGELVFITHLLDAWFLVESQWNFYGRFRFTNVLHETKDGWRFIYQHYSTPDAKAGEEDTIGYAQINAENQQLREAISRRTKELEEKNRDLEIESALEKVRAVAMGMQKPEDLSNIGKTIFYELKSLGFITIRNSEIVINSEGKEALKSYHYSEYGKVEVIEINYQENALVKKWANDLKKASNIFVPVTILENKMKEWKAYRKKLGYKSDPKMTRAKAVHYYSYSTGLGALSISTWEKISEDQIRILERFRNVFLLSYKRYIDIKIAEAQAREAQIESALERVRAASMAMHSSSDLFNVIQKLTEQLVGLNIYFDHAYFAKLDDRYNSNLWISTPAQSYPADIHAPYFDHSIIRSLRDNPGSEFLNQFITKKEKDEFFTWFFQLPEFKNFPESRKKLVLSEKGYCRSGFKIRSIWLTIAKYQLEPFSDEENKIFERFAKVFEQSYTRFLDLQKAEAQAREAEIQLALERVRARTMAMHKTVELIDVIHTVFGQLKTLGFDATACGLTLFKKEDKSMTMWLAGFDTDAYPESYFVPYIDHPLYKAQLEAWEKGQTFQMFKFEGELKRTYDELLFSQGDFKSLPSSAKEAILSIHTATNWTAFMKYGMLESIMIGDEVLTGQQADILQRLAKVFEQTYTRYLDLQKAEAQAREAQIEAALEKIRSRSLAMHNSHELKEVVAVLYQKLQELDFDMDQGAAVMMTYAPDSADHTQWITDASQTYAVPFFIPFTEHTIAIDQLNARKNNLPFISKLYNKKEKNAYFRHLFKYTDYHQIPDPVKQMILDSKNFGLSIAFEKNSAIAIPSTIGKLVKGEEIHILKRFSNVFEQSYTRFLDLQRAEAQAREAEIQLALERVRARTMAMQHSAELNTVSTILFNQLRSLGGHLWTCGIALCNENSSEDEFRTAFEHGIQPSVFVPNNVDEVHIKMYQGWKDQIEIYTQTKGGEALKSHYDYMMTLPSIKPVFESMLAAGIQLPMWQKWHAAYFTAGYLLVITTEPYSDEQVLVRFAKVFEQAYTRFLDLQKAEKQAREAQIETSMERVRSRSLAMQKPEEIIEVAELLREEMGQLGVEELETSSIYIMGENDNADCWYAIKDIRDEYTQLVSDEMTLRLTDTWVGQQMWNFYQSDEVQTSIIMKGEQRLEWINYCADHSKVLQSYYGEEIPERTYHLVKFNGGYMGAASLADISYESWDLLRRAATVFSLAFTRFKDLQDAAARAREAQIQLALERVRARTMAMQKSDELGEAALLLFQQLRSLGIQSYSSGFTVWENNDSELVSWMCNADGSINPPFRMPAQEIEWHRQQYLSWKKKEDYIIHDFTGKEMKDYFKYLRSFSLLDEAFKKSEAAGVTTPVRQVHHAFNFSNGNLLIIMLEPAPECIDIFRRFAKTFDQTYTRFLDLKKAEAQAREAQIEAALERVRAASMAMHSSKDLFHVIQKLTEQLVNLNINFESASFIKIKDQSNLNLWISTKMQLYPANIRLPYFKHPIVDDYMAAGHSSGQYLNMINSKGEKDSFFKRFFQLEVLKDIPESRKKYVFDAEGYCRSTFHLEHISLTIAKYENNPFSDDENRIFGRFAKVFEQAYTRFLDLQKAEEQAREAQIEAALERVRSQAMAMRQSSDLLDIVVKMRNEFTNLGHEAHYFWYMRWLPEKYEKAMTSGDGTRIGMIMSLPRHLHGDIPLVDEWEKSEVPYLVFTMDVEAAIKYVDKMVELGDFELVDPNAPSHDDIRHINGLTFIMARTMHGEIGYSLPGVVPDPPADDIKTLLRFAGVFDLAYRRFEDLKLTEQKNRETEIELALEKVRSRTMAMQKSEELKDVIKIVFEQFVHLNINAEHAGFVVDYTPLGDWHFWIADKNEIPAQITHPYFESVWANQFNEAKERGIDLFTTHLNYEEKNKFYRELLSYIPGLPEDSRQFYLSCPGLAASTTLMENVALYIENFSAIPYGEKENAILIRFGKVFQQTYTRFLDLQKAEAQAREAQIEAALEKVRSRSLAMHKTDELQEVVTVVLDRMTDLNIELDTINLNIFNSASKELNLWTAAPHQKYAIPFHLPFFNHSFHTDIFTAREQGLDFFTKTYSLVEKDSYFHHTFEHSDFRHVPENKKKLILESTACTRSIAYTKNAAILLIRYSDKPFSEIENEILIRFAKVFEQAYTRFLDLQKAEALARESQIELGLERVRARAMAMQNSDELKELIGTVFTELTKLDLALTRCIIWVFEPATKAARWWIANSEEPSNPMSFYIKYHEHPAYLNFVQEWKNQNIKFVYDLNGADKITWDDILFNDTELKQLPDIVKNGMKAPERVLLSASFNNFGGINVASLDPLSDEHFDLLLRFAKVFDLTYTRFNDLQKAEAQAREAQIEVALERVRSRTLAMQKSDELSDTAAILFQQLIALGIAPNRLFIILMKEDRAEMEAWLTDEDGSKVSMGFTGNYTRNGSLLKMYEGWKEQKKSLVIDMQGAELQHYFHYLHDELKVPFKGGLKQKRRIQYLAYFSHGLIGMASPDEQPAETVQLLERFTAVFNLTFIRFNDLKIAEAHALQAEQDLIAVKEARKKAEAALTELQSTQKQLIQSEKMASLGELTAGIAHEIQNPLNFVNNFSEVSKELLDEMKAVIENGNIFEAKHIINDLIQNLEKINHHGKRADGIVKGMLQHSRSNTGQKEPTDLNALCDEYVRLAYHGLRAKEKAFNAKFETSLDETIGKINVLPQDIGRVMLNLLNNAFYAVNERSKEGDAEYQPIVSVTTKLMANSQVQIVVKDNGNGIPENIKDKIFQPFFTTKPTGQGTGLGLSLSYDIVKAHGGEIKLETSEGEGTTFIITLPK